MSTPPTRIPAFRTHRRAGRRDRLGDDLLAGDGRRNAVADGHWVHVEGSQAAIDEEEGVVYLVLALRNVGAGLAVLQAWHPWDTHVLGDVPHPDPGDFRPHTRDIYIAPGDTGLWQGAIRDRQDAVGRRISAARSERRPISVDLLYSDQVGGQRTISRFGLIPAGEDRWLGSVGRHWNLDHAGPR